MNIANLRRPFAAWLWLGALLWVTNVLAAPVPTSLAPSIDLSPMVELLEDRDGTLTMADVRSAALADRFQSGPPRIGHSTSAWWLRLRVRTDSHQGGTWWLDSGNRMLQELDVFSPDETGAYRQQSASSTRVFADRPLPTANFVFPLTLPPGSETAIYLRARSTSYVPTNLTPVLWQPDAYQRLEQQHHRWMHFYLGLALALATLNLFLYLSLRDTIYLRYVLSVIGVVFSADSVPSGFGLFFQYFWPESPHFQQVAWAIGITCVYLAVRFLASFVEWSRLAPRLDRAGKVFFGLIGVWAALIIFGVLDTAPAQWGQRLLQIGFVLYFTWAFSSLIWFAWQGDRNHRLALIAWGPITLMGIINPLLQVLRLRTDQMLPPIMTGSALEMLLMSLILADRFNQARKEKERAQAALVAGLQQSERELEGKVADRTAEVKAQAAQLDEWNHRLEHRVQEQVEQIDRLGRLKRFFSPQLADVIVAGGEEALKTHRREVSVVFIDLRGFTAFTDRAEPEEVMEMLRAFHATMGRIVMEHNGTLERFAGDSVMVFFNDPVPMENHAEQAVLMALEMQEAFVSLSEHWTQRGFNLGLGCGIALGYATLGEIGFEGRWDYAAIGSVTNLAARLCAEAAAGEVLVDQKMMDKVGPMVGATKKGSLTLKGFAQPVPVFALARFEASI